MDEFDVAMEETSEDVVDSIEEALQRAEDEGKGDPQPTWFAEEEEVEKDDKDPYPDAGVVARRYLRMLYIDLMEPTTEPFDG